MGVNSKRLFCYIVAFCYFVHSVTQVAYFNFISTSLLPRCLKQLWENQIRKRIYLYPHKSQNGCHCLGPPLTPQPQTVQFLQPKKCRQCQSPGRHRQTEKRQIIERTVLKNISQYFKGNRILPIPELVEAVQPKTLSLIVTDIKTRRLAGLKKRNLSNF